VRILGLDIETAPNSVHVWGLFNQNIGINQIQQTGRVMCWAAKWYGERQVEFRSEHEEGEDAHRAMIERAHELLDQADAVLSYNGKRFDMPTLNREFLKYGMPPPSPYHHIDLLLVAKKQFRFVSNKMDNLARELGIKGKVRHSGHEMWTNCMAGDDKAWAMMERYNKQDVRMMEKLYEAMLPWIVTHPNHGMYSDESRPVCTNCGSHRLQARGHAMTRTQKYRRFQCTDCGTWTRERVNCLDADKRRITLTQVA
jgi:DNA polymerase elongation subunit (family B)/DNA-directed RNA polymerase subunit RPC12/RpoP